jgi:hypothetical protein
MQVVQEPGDQLDVCLMAGAKQSGSSPSKLAAESRGDGSRCLGDGQVDLSDGPSSERGGRSSRLQVARAGTGLTLLGGAGG